MNGDGSPDLYNLSSSGSEVALYAGGGQYTATASFQGSDAVLDNGDIGDLDAAISGLINGHDRRRYIT